MKARKPGEAYVVQTMRTWSVYVDDVLVEGGFFEKANAIRLAENLNKAKGYK